MARHVCQCESRHSSNLMLGCRITAGFSCSSDERAAWHFVTIFRDVYVSAVKRCRIESITFTQRNLQK